MLLNEDVQSKLRVFQLFEKLMNVRIDGENMFFVKKKRSLCEEATYFCVLQGSCNAGRPEKLWPVIYFN